MATKRPWHTAVVIAAGWLAGFHAIATNGASLSASEIRDNAGLFSSSAISTAKESLNALEDRHKVPVLIETHATIPAEKAAAFQALSKSERDGFYRKWIDEINQKEKLHGLLVLITKSPGHVEFFVPPELERRGFDSGMKSSLNTKLLENFKNKKFDEGLTSSVSFLSSVGPSLKSASSTGVYQPRPVQRTTSHTARNDSAVLPGQSMNHRGSWSIWNWLILAGVIWLVFIVISSVIRGVFGGGRGPVGMGGPGGAGYGAPGYGGAGYGGGGGFMSNMLGGLAGAVAGNWLYDSMFNSHSSAAHGADWGHSGDSNLMGNDSSSDSGSYGGGDFGDSGGDFGGGDFGGDSGGGYGGGDF